MKRPKGAHPIYWRSFPYSPPSDWLPMSISEMADVTKGKLPKTLLSNPTERSVPYLLIDGLNNGASLHTEDTDLPMITPEDTVVVADGSRSGLPIRGISGALGSTLLRYRAKEGFDGDFLYYLLESLYPFTNTATIGGAVPHLDKRLLSQLVLKIPRQPERKMLGKIFRAVDEVVSATNAELLAAQRLKTALMQQLFTKGVPGRHKEFKETKIGRVPEEWDILRGKQCIQIKGLYSPIPSDAGEEGDCHYLKVSDFNLDGNEKVIHKSQLNFWRDNHSNSRLYPPGLIVIAKRGEALRHNRVRFTGAFCMIDPNLMLLDSVEGVTTNQYLYHYFSYRGMARFCEDAGIPQLNNKDIYPRWFPVPKMDEQMEIVELLETADSYVSAVSYKIRTLEKLKKSLLQNLLTGKVRVNMEAQA